MNATIVFSPKMTHDVQIDRLMIDGKSNAYIYTVTYIGHCVLPGTYILSIYVPGFTVYTLNYALLSHLNSCTKSNMFNKQYDQLTLCYVQTIEEVNSCVDNDT